MFHINSIVATIEMTEIEKDTEIINQLINKTSTNYPQIHQNYKNSAYFPA